MSRALDAAYRNIRHNIPEGVLNTVFRSNTSVYPSNINNNIYEAIYTEVIKDRVLGDCALRGGVSTRIQLNPSWHEPTTYEENVTNLGGQGPFGLYRIPPEARQNTNITEIQAVVSPIVNPHQFPLHTRNSGNIERSAINMVDSYTGNNTIPTPVGDILPGNILRLHPAQFSHQDWIVYLTLQHDEKMNSLSSAGIIVFEQLCTIAVKQYCYNKLILNLDIGYVEQGREIQSVKDIVSNWSDLDQEYRELLAKYSYSNTLGDTQNMIDYIRFQV